MSENEDKSYIILAVGVASLVLSFIFAIIDGIQFHDWKNNIHFAPDLSNHVWAFFLLGFYSTYRYVVENTKHKEGLWFPNAWKIVVAMFAFFAISLISVAYLWGETVESVAYVLGGSVESLAYLWGEMCRGIGSDPNLLVESIIKLIDYILELSASSG